MAAPEDVTVDADAALLERLRAGDEDAFMTLVDKYGPLMLRIALTHVRTRAVAEEVVQEAWLGVLKPEDLDPADRGEHRAHPRGTRSAQHPAVLAGAGHG